MKRIGIMGGTFDPVHNGHLLLGKQAYEEYGLDEIWYMPSHIPPHKKDRKSQRQQKPRENPLKNRKKIAKNRKIFFKKGLTNRNRCGIIVKRSKRAQKNQYVAE